MHHIVEKRFANSIGIKNADDMLSIPLTKDVHQQYTNAWRQILPYGHTYSIDQITAAARAIYAGNPELLEAAIYTIREKT